MVAFIKMAFVFSQYTEAVKKKKTENKFTFTKLLKFN